MCSARHCFLGQRCQNANEENRSMPKSTSTHASSGIHMWASDVGCCHGNASSQVHILGGNMLSASLMNMRQSKKAAKNVERRDEQSDRSTRLFVHRPRNVSSSAVPPSPTRRRPSMCRPIKKRRLYSPSTQRLPCVARRTSSKYTNELRHFPFTEKTSSDL